MIKFSPSLMCADFLNLGRDIRELDRAGADYYHIDIMDGHFVPNLSLNFDILKQMKAVTSTPIDVHLMVENPEDYFDRLIEIKVDTVAFHVEAARCPLRYVKYLRQNGIKPGIAISPSTGLDGLLYLLNDIDQVLIMTVEPGFAGQKFIPEMADKISFLDQERKRRGGAFRIEVDGDINLENGKRCAGNGADILVLGTASIFKGDGKLFENYSAFKKQITNSGLET